MLRQMSVTAMYACGLLLQFMLRVYEHSIQSLGASACMSIRIECEIAWVCALYARV